ncbi:hypothetical protein IQ230_03990 [Gloeocapsopsis crepidinum LEGE 06123]|uniref:AMIN domain-containing protein n=1 Tax=Gloeocapsopsis crepidinum LEGE 06123 TaxID=588587 RepID=A0ABR9UMN5_9CHRO|nr:hypothetical protein [Gloeocapsopsis crepidinum]MBE9189540.1 hypothetical protein [Gloeocapsopsis crepidinum LEGE 06123]
MPIISGSAAFAVPRGSKLYSQVQPSPSSPSLNPRPSIFSEPPYNRTQTPVSPSSDIPVSPTTPGTTPPSPCPPTAPSSTPAPSSVTQPPLPEQQQAPITRVMPVDGRVNIRLTNTTNAVIFYQVIGNTEQRSLAGKSEVTLRDLPAPVSLTFSRQDRGLLRPTLSATSMGLLEVTLDATTDLAEDRTTIRVQQDGAVLVN